MNVDNDKSNYTNKKDKLNTTQYKGEQFKRLRYKTKMQVQEKMIKNYFDFYKFPKPINKNYVPILNELTNVHYVSYEDYNKDKESDKQTIQTRETNKHIILQQLRSIAENTNIIENVHMTTKSEENDYIYTDRTIFDINGSRIMKSGLPMYLLKCNAEVTDFDRIRNLDANKKIIKQKFRKTISQYEVDRLFEQYMIDDDKYDFNEFQLGLNRKIDILDKEEREKEKNKEGWVDELIEEFEGDLLTCFREHGEEFDQDTLINLTDIIYYLSPKELYEVAEYLKDGTIIVGTAHVPKHLDLDEHIIQFGDKIEGKVRICYDEKEDKNNLLISLDKAIFKMETFGNDHTYTHSLDYIKYIRPDTSALIPMPNDKEYDFILKAIPSNDNYDCGATIYTRFKIIKITNPRIDDYFCRKDTEPNALGVRKTMERMNTIREKLEYIRERQMIFPVIKNTILQYRVEEEKRRKEYQKLQKEQQYQQELEDFINRKVNQKDGYYYLSSMGERTWYGVRTLTKLQLDPITTMYDVKTIKKEIIQKAMNKILLLEKIDRKNIKGIISLLCKELPEHSVIDDIIPLTSRLLKDSMEAEIKIKSMMNSKLVEYMNALKDNKLKEIYQGQSLIRKIYRYVKNIFTLTKEDDYDVKNITELDF